MILQELFTAINSRLTGDSTLVATGVVVLENFVSDNQNYPYIVVDVAMNGQTRDAFGANQVLVQCDVHCFTSNTPADMTTRVLIADRVYGNSFNFTNFVPTVGLHRWTPALDPTQQGWNSAGVMSCERAYAQHEENAYHDIFEFQVWCYQVYTAPSP